jgi:hypothetical protein
VTTRRRPSSLLAALPLLSLTACASTTTVTLGQAVRDLAPDYRVRAPANSTADLGRRLLGDAPETNACFDGDPGAASPSWSAVTLTYADLLDGKVSADLGAAVKVSPSLRASANRSAAITLADLVEQRLSAVYLNPSGACAGLFAAPGTSYVKVLTRAIKAGSIEVKADQAITAGLQLDVASIGGVSTSGSTSSGKKLQGTSLFFADFPECLSVTYTKKDCADAPVGPGHVCDLESCSFTVAALDTGSGAWEGRLSCEGGGPPSFTGKLGEWGQAQKTAPGVAYNVRVLAGARLGTVSVDLRRWVTRSEAPEKCAPPPGR